MGGVKQKSKQVSAAPMGKEKKLKQVSEAPMGKEKKKNNTFKKEAGIHCPDGPG